MQAFRRTLIIFSSLSLCLWACGDDGNGGGFEKSESGEIELDPSSRTIDVELGQVSVGDVIAYPIRVLNVGDAVLTVSDISLSYQAPASGDSHSPAFALQLDQSLPIQVGQLGGDLPGEFTVTVKFTRQDDFNNRKATLTIKSDDRDEEDQVIDVEFASKQAAAVINVSPTVVDLDVVPLQKEECRNINVTNTGTDELIVHSFSLGGHPDLSLNIGEEKYNTSEETLAGLDLDAPLQVAPGDTNVVQICLEPQTPEPVTGQLVFFSNDPNAANGKTVVVLANHDVPCINVSPPTVNFGGIIVGTKAQLPVEICSCGTAALKLKGVRLLDEVTSPDFSLLLDGIPGIDPATGIDPNVPFVLEVNECTEVLVQCVPNVLSPLGPDNQAQPDTGTLMIESNTFEAEIEVPLSCAGIEADCPTAVASVQEGEDVIPQTTLHLRGDQSYPAPGFEITSYSWSVEQPVGSSSAFVPNSVFPNPVFDVNAAGLYSFTLTVWDNAGTEGCEPAKVDVVVIPDEAIHVELLWTTECDKDKTDLGEGQGTDMDLHFAHPFATGPDIDGDTKPDPWFDEPFDCFYFNKEPNWGTFDPDVQDDPSLDLDDIDGWGPENLNINIPEVGADYSIGVHYWNDHGYGPSKATVRVYIYGELDVEVADVELNGLDMWNVAVIPWESEFSTTQVNKDPDGNYLITPKYQNPFFISPCFCNGQITQECNEPAPPEGGGDDGGDGGDDGGSEPPPPPPEN